MFSAAERLLRKLASLRLIDIRLMHQLQESDHLRRLFRDLEIDCVFDVGANCGQYAKMLREYAGFTGHIISFEPLPLHARELRQISEGDSLWNVEEVALAGKTGTSEFHVMVHSEFSSLSTPRQEDVTLFKEMNLIRDVITVKTETLDEAYARLHAEFKFERPFLKMDTQGMDVEILKSGRGVAKHFLGIQSELAIRRLYNDSVDFREALSFYQSLGFELSALVSNNAGHFPAIVEIDCIMVRADILDVRLNPVPCAQVVPGLAKAKS